MNVNPNIRFEDWEAEQMQDPGLRAAAEKLEPAYETARDEILGSDAKWRPSRCTLKRGAVEMNGISEAAGIIQQLLNCLPDSDVWDYETWERRWDKLSDEMQEKVKDARRAAQEFLASVDVCDE